MNGVLLGALGVVSGAVGPPPAHPNSYSLSEVQIRGRSVRVELRVQVLYPELIKLNEAQYDARVQLAIRARALQRAATDNERRAAAAAQVSDSP